MPSVSASGAKGCPDCACQNQCLLGQQRDISRAQWSTLVVERPFRKGDLLTQQGRSSSTFQTIKVGSALALRTGEDGVAHPVAILGHGQQLDSAALLRQPAPLSMQALSAGRMCEVAVGPALEQGLLNVEFLHGLAQSHSQSTAWVADWARVVRMRGALAQLAGALLQLAQAQRSTLVRLPSHTVMASLLATTRETIARTLRQLAEQDCLIRHDRWYCEIHRARLLALTHGPSKNLKT
jgi:CRP/FNR family cyclic AMP-dependent transcriptional regulator